MLLTIVLAALVGWFAYSLFAFYRFTSKLPPGPTAIPLIGNLFRQLNPPKFFLDFRRLAKQYGPVFSVHMPFPIVNVCDYDILKEVLKSDDFTGRMQNEIFEVLRNQKNGGVITSNGEVWREQRRAAITILRDFGMGKAGMEEKVTQSALECIRCIKDQENTDAVDLRWPIQLFVANIINEALFGHRYRYDNCEPLVKYVEGLQAMMMEMMRSPAMLIFLKFPFLRHVPFLNIPFKTIYNNSQKVQSYVVREVEKCTESYVEDSEPECFVHAYIQKQKTNSALNHQQLISCCADLFLAGQETTTTTMRWATLFMASHQHVQDKLREEITRVVGVSRIPTLTDKNRMPYTQACILELQRRANIITNVMIVFHRATVDTEINGLKIPQNTVINADYHNVMATDPHFVEPEKFMPERYLMEDGVTLKKELVERTVPFGMGKRQCAGEGLARVELFIGLTALIQAFKILPPIDGSGVDLEPIYTPTHLPKPHKLQLIPLN